MLVKAEAGLTRAKVQDLDGSKLTCDHHLALCIPYTSFFFRLVQEDVHVARHRCASEFGAQSLFRIIIDLGRGRGGSGEDDKGQFWSSTSLRAA